LIILRKSCERGYANHGWLESWHSFSFAKYSDPEHIHFGPLRVINEDIIQPASGFGSHGHRNMEILTYVLSGTLRHGDSMGNFGDIAYGEVQVMSAGTGVQHSEVNPALSESVHLLQIWIMPDKLNVTPGYRQKKFPLQNKQSRWCQLASRNGSEDSLIIHQDAQIFVACLKNEEKLDYRIKAGRKIYLYVARGSVKVNEYALSAGDALMFSGEDRVNLAALSDMEVLLFDLK